MTLIHISYNHIGLLLIIHKFLLERKIAILAWVMYTKKENNQVNL